MCSGCRERKSKRELIRVVRPPEGELFIDPTGKASGRGAYLCVGSTACLERAIKTKALERMLEHTIQPDLFEKLRQQLPMAEPLKDGE